MSKKITKLPKEKPKEPKKQKQENKPYITIKRNVVVTFD